MYHYEDVLKTKGASENRKTYQTYLCKMKPKRTERRLKNLIYTGTMKARRTEVKKKQKNG